MGGCSYFRAGRAGRLGTGAPLSHSRQHIPGSRPCSPLQRPPQHIRLHLSAEALTDAITSMAFRSTFAAATARVRSRKTQRKRGAPIQAFQKATLAGGSCRADKPANPDLSFLPVKRERPLWKLRRRVRGECLERKILRSRSEAQAMVGVGQNIGNPSGHVCCPVIDCSHPPQHSRPRPRTIHGRRPCNGLPPSLDQTPVRPSASLTVAELRTKGEPSSCCRSSPRLRLPRRRPVADPSRSGLRRSSTFLR